MLWVDAELQRALGVHGRGGCWLWRHFQVRPGSERSATSRNLAGRKRLKHDKNPCQCEVNEPCSPGASCRHQDSNPGWVARITTLLLATWLTKVYPKNHLSSRDVYKLIEHEMPGADRLPLQQRSMCFATEVNSHLEVFCARVGRGGSLEGATDGRACRIFIFSPPVCVYVWLGEREGEREGWTNI